VKTTVVLRDDIYSFLVSRFGKRKLSESINESLFEHFFREKRRDLFGVDPWLKKTSLRNLRDEHDRDF
jgi:hypothetical protein